MRPLGSTRRLFRALGLQVSPSSRLSRLTRFLFSDLFSSQITEWRKLRDAGVLEGKSPGKRSASPLLNRQKSGVYVGS